MWKNNVYERADAINADKQKNAKKSFILSEKNILAETALTSTIGFQPF